MTARTLLNLRMIADFALLAAGLAVPFVLRPISRSAGVLLTGVIACCICIALWFDGLQAWQRLHTLDSN